MDLKNLVSQFAYRIEQKPDGGFIARVSDPSISPLEAPTREDLLKKIQEKVLADLSAEFPGLKLPLDGSQHQFAFHVERTPAGGFSIHSADPSADVVHAATEQDLQTHVLGKILNAAGKHFLPQLSQAIAAQGNAANLKVIVNKTSFKMNADSGNIALGSTTTVFPTGAAQATSPITPTLDGASFPNADLSNTDLSKMMIDGSPITPQAGNVGKLVRLLPALLLLGALIYFLLHRA
jgi:hypothetical protein